jgi:hypothetical protein
VSTLIWVPRSNIWSKRHDSDCKKSSYLDLAKINQSVVAGRSLSITSTVDLHTWMSVW